MVAKLMFPRRLAQPTDPMSGFFAVRVAALDMDRLQPIGFKILMEIVVQNPLLRMAEVPFSMHARFAGTSKASLKEGLRFAGHLARLRLAVRGGRPTDWPAPRRAAGCCASCCSAWWG